MAQVPGWRGVEFAGLGQQDEVAAVLGRDAGRDQAGFAQQGEAGGERGGPPELSEVIGQF